MGERAMPDLERGERLQIMLSADELRAVEDWRFARRMPSRAAAVRELLRRLHRRGGRRAFGQLRRTRQG